MCVSVEPYPDPRDVLYRAEEMWWSGGWVDEHGNEHPGEPRLTIRTREFAILKRTPCGAWIKHYVGRKFVRLDSRKRYAHASKDEAMQALIARKKRQVQILRAQLMRAEKAYAGAKALAEKGKHDSDGYLY